MSDQPATAAGRGSIAYEPCYQDGHSHDWRDCPTPEDWATTTAATEPHEFVKTWLDTCATCGQGIESADFALHGWDDDDDA